MAMSEDFVQDYMGHLFALALEPNHECEYCADGDITMQIRCTDCGMVSRHYECPGCGLLR